MVFTPSERRIRWTPLEIRRTASVRHEVNYQMNHPHNQEVPCTRKQLIVNHWYLQTRHFTHKSVCSSRLVLPKRMGEALAALLQTPL